MTQETEQNNKTITQVHLDELDFSSLVGNEIVIFSEQLGGQPLKSRVVLVNDRTISVDRTGNAGRIDCLVNNQMVTLKFNYKGEPVAIKGTIKKSQGGNCNILLEENAHPLAMRRFDRFELSLPIKMAPLTIETFDKSKIAKLRWMQTDTLNLSAGGLLLEMAGFLKSGSYLILNLNTEDFEFPALVLAQVRYCLQASRTRHKTGIEFVTREMSAGRFDMSMIKKFPPVVFEFNELTREELKNKLKQVANS